MVSSSGLGQFYRKPQVERALLHLIKAISRLADAVEALDRRVPQQNPHVSLLGPPETGESLSAGREELLAALQAVEGKTE